MFCAQFFMQWYKWTLVHFCLICIEDTHNSHWRNSITCICLTTLELCDVESFFKIRVASRLTTPLLEIRFSCHPCRKCPCCWEFQHWIWIVHPSFNSCMRCYSWWEYTLQRSWCAIVSIPHSGRGIVCWLSLIVQSVSANERLPVLSAV